MADGAISITKAIRATLRGWGFIVAGGMLGALCALLIMCVQTPAYTATAVVSIEPAVTSSSGLVDSQLQVEVIATEMERARSGETLQRAAMPLGVSVDELRDRVSVTTDFSGPTLRISYRGESAVGAREGADAVADGYLAVRGEDLSAQVQMSLASLDARSGILSQAYATALARLSAAQPGTPAAATVEAEIARIGRESESLAEMRGVVSGQRTDVGEVLVPASEATVSSDTHPTRWILAGSLVGFVVGCAMAYLYGRRAFLVRSPSALADVLHAPVWQPSRMAADPWAMARELLRHESWRYAKVAVLCPFPDTRADAVARSLTGGLSRPASDHVDGARMNSALVGALTASRDADAVVLVVPKGTKSDDVRRIVSALAARGKRVLAGVIAQTNSVVTNSQTPTGVRALENEPMTRARRRLVAGPPLDPRRASTRGRSWSAPSLPRWPFALPFVSYPVCWFLGVSDFIWVISAAVMVAVLLRTRNVRLPRGAGWWVLFLLWVCASGAMVDTSGRALGAVYRLLLYGAAGIIALYVYNSHRTLTMRYVTGVMTFFLGVMTAGGYLAMAAPLLTVRTPLAWIMPSALAQNELIGEMIVRRTTQWNPDAWVSQLPRPSAPFVFANTWGNVYSLVLPLALIYLALVWRTSRRWLALAVILASLVPAAATLNRGMFLGLAIIGVWCLVQSVRRGAARSAVVGASIGLICIAGWVASGAAASLLQRAETSSSTEDRSGLYWATAERVIASPILGYGAPRPADAPWLPSLGTQGQLWTVLFSHGIIGLLLFLATFLAVIPTIVRRTDTIGAVLGGIIIATLVETVYYGMLTGIMISLPVVALLQRSVRAAPAPARVHFASAAHPARK